MAVALLDYQEQNSRYNALIMKSSVRGFELFESKLAAREEPGRQIDSLRALYDLWVDAAEEAYAEIALSPEFREVYGALVNAQMRVRSQIQQEVERIATDFGMPTRSELDSIGQRLHDLRREMRGAGTGESSDLAREVADLRREVAALKAAMNAKSAPPRETRPARSAVAKAPTARKRARPARQNKRAPQVAALRAGVQESVSIPSSKPKSPPPARVRAQVTAARARAQARAAVHGQRPTSPPQTRRVWPRSRTRRAVSAIRSQASRNAWPSSRRPRGRRVRQAPPLPCTPRARTALAIHIAESAEPCNP